MSAQWGDYGPAEFDRRRMPRGRRSAPAAQAGLFVMAAKPTEPPARPATVQDDPDQLGLFPVPGSGESDPPGVQS